MQQEIIKLVASKAGISESVAKIAVEAVMSVLKNKLPGVLGGQLDSLLGASSKTPISSKKPTSSTKTVSTKKPTSSKTTKKTAEKDSNPLGGLVDIVGGLLGGKK
ncbi:MAG: DUF2267 domain-containing protein [Dysgonamonadaceae bacterium]|jgi:hypothetical protein|nr:DUF2267 domain-containing protein [Dysgonamonadaceae bacterium]